MDEIELYKKINKLVDSYYDLGINDKEIINYFNKGKTTVNAIVKRLKNNLTEDDMLLEKITIDVLRDRVAQYIDINN